jgi:hypothetical protein
VLRTRSRARAGRRVRLSGSVSRAVLDQCCSGDLGYLLLQINVICLLLALIGAAAIVKHPAWFGAVPVPIAQTIAQR